ncbi:hypothetical protein NKI01_09025 [Mesorhizobium sp. M0815]|uniref:hypothetical protein n=1 Tax=Mesorhizobium sp. M0815 TaxID=2957005 RepID=UPI003336F0E6
MTPNERDTEGDGKALAGLYLFEAFANTLIAKGVIDKSDWIQSVKTASEAARGGTLTTPERQNAKVILQDIHARLSGQKK